AWFVSMVGDDVTIRALNGKPRTIMSKVGRIQTLAFTPDGTRLCIVTNNASDDLPTSNTRITIFGRDARGWRQTNTHTVEGARQENDAAFLSRDVLLLDAELIDLSTGRSTPSAAPELSAVSGDGRALLFLDNTGNYQRWARVVDGKIGPLLEA